MKRKGYIIPDTVNPGTAVCATVFIPADPLYIAAFWRSVEYLAQWVAWEEPGGNTAKTAADVWRYWFSKSREVWAESTLCEFPVADPVYPLDPAAELQDILWFIKTTIEDIDGMLGIGSTPAQIKYALRAIIATAPGVSVLIDVMAGLTAQERADAIAGWSWQDMFDGLWCFGDECDLSDYSGALGFFGWTECAVSKALGYISTQTGHMVDFIGHSLDVVSSAILGDWAWLVDGAGFDEWGWDAPICYDWEHVFDFTQDDYDFSILTQGGSPCGSWESGVGWKAIYCDTQGSGGGYYVWLRSPVVADTSFQKCRIKVAWDDDETYFRVVRTSARNNGSHVGYWSNIVVYTPPGPTPNDTSYTAEASRTGDQIELRLTMVHQGAPQPEQGALSDGRVTELTLWGNGSDPF